MGPARFNRLEREPSSVRFTFQIWLILDKNTSERDLNWLNLQSRSAQFTWIDQLSCGEKMFNSSIKYGPTQPLNCRESAMLSKPKLVSLSHVCRGQFFTFFTDKVLLESQLQNDSHEIAR